MYVLPHAHIYTRVPHRCTCTHLCAHTHILTLANAHMHTLIHTHTHTPTHAHVHTLTSYFPNKILRSMRLVLLVYLPIALSAELSLYYTTNIRPTNRSQLKMFTVFYIAMSKVTSPLTIYR